MLADKATLEGVYEEFKALFEEQLQSQQTPFDISPFTTFVPCSTIQVTYNWLTELPGMRRWLGDRIVHGLKAETYSVENYPYEDTLGVDKRDIETDNLGIYRPKVQALAGAAKRHVFKLFAGVLEGNAVCADGQNLIDTDHPNDAGGTWSNKGTTALSFTTLDAALYSGAEVTDSDGYPAGIAYNVLMVPPRLRATAFQLCYSQGLPGSANNDVNYLQQDLGITVVVNPFLTDTNNWYLFDTTMPIKPVIHQERKAPTLDMDETNVFKNRMIQYGIDGDYALAPGLPHGLYGAIVT